MQNTSYEIEQMNLETAGYISSKVKKMLLDKGIDKMIVRRVSIAAYEAEINVVIHSYGGKCIITNTEDRLQIEFIDKGPGIIDIDKAMQEGYSTASPLARENGFGAGMGLSNIKKSCDEFNIESTVNGTHLTLIFKL